MSQAGPESSSMPPSTPTPARTLDEWRELAAAVINKGKAEGDALPVDEAIAAMRTTVDAGLVVEPLYAREGESARLGVPGAMPFTRGRALRDPYVPWDVRGLHDDPDPAVSRPAVLADLENGVTSIWLHVGADGIAPSEVAEVLADVQLDLAPVVVSSFDDQAGAAAALYAVLSPSSEARGNLGHDPLGAAARVGDEVTEASLAPLADAVGLVADRPGIRAITVDSRVYADAGATVSDEVALAIATGVAYLRGLEASGVGLTDAFGQIEFRVSAGADQFLTAASLRALRRMWARVGESVGVPDSARGAFTHAVTSGRMFSRDDAWTNILRSTIAAFGASVGGADAITVLPFDTVSGLPTPFSRRIARNTQILLSDESNVAKVTDPAGGSWALEALTNDVAESAWAAFQGVEKAGGMVAALANGVVAGRISASVAERDRAIATRQQPITGISMFPLAGEKPLDRAPRATLHTSPKALVPHRNSAVFEALRDRSAAYEKEHGSPPRVAVATLDIPRAADRRIDAINLLTVAGLVATTPDEPHDVTLTADDTGYVGVGPRADIVAFLTDLLDEIGAPA